MTVAKVRPDLRSVDAPDELKAVNGWLIWRYEATAEGKPPRKVPYYVDGARRHGVQGSPEDRSRLSSFGAAKEAAARRGFDGIGLAMLGWGFSALDLDHCVTDDGVHPEVYDLVGSSYAEFSPSGKGVRVFVKGEMPDMKLLDRQPFPVEAFYAKGFVTFTGDVMVQAALTGAGVEAPTATVQAVMQRERKVSNNATTGMDTRVMAECLDAIEPDMTYHDWVRVGMAIYHETDGDGFSLWDDWSAQGSKYPGRDVMLEKWESFGGHPGPIVSGRTLLHMAEAAGAHVTQADIDAFDAMPVARRGRFQFISADEFAKTGKEATWLIDAVIPEAPITMIYGASGSGKTFVALDMAAAIATGTVWRGRAVKQTPVLYVCAEGATGFKMRLRAYQAAKGTSLTHMSVLAGVTPDLRSAAEMQELINAVEGQEFGVMVIDTLAASAPGANENSSEDMGRVLHHCKHLHIATGASIILVHHSGKDDSKGSRGWSGLKGNVDAEIEVARDGEKRRMTVTKMKDGVDGEVLPFTLKPIDVETPSGREVTSCIVDHLTGAPVTVFEGENAAIMLHVDLWADERGWLPLKGLDDALDVFGIQPAPGRRDPRQKKLRACLDRLLAAHMLVESNGYIRRGREDA